MTSVVLFYLDAVGERSVFRVINIETFWDDAENGSLVIKKHL